MGWCRTRVQFLHWSPKGQVPSTAQNDLILLARGPLVGAPCFFPWQGPSCLQPLAQLQPSASTLFPNSPSPAPVAQSCLAGVGPASVHPARALLLFLGGRRGSLLLRRIGESVELSAARLKGPHLLPFLVTSRGPSASSSGACNALANPATPTNLQVTQHHQQRQPGEHTHFISPAASPTASPTPVPRPLSLLSFSTRKPALGPSLTSEAFFSCSSCLTSSWYKPLAPAQFRACLLFPGTTQQRVGSTKALGASTASLFVSVLPPPLPPPALSFVSGGGDALPCPQPTTHTRRNRFAAFALRVRLRFVFDVELKRRNTPGACFQDPTGRSPLAGCGPLSAK